jgi:hypothetical protein
MENIKVLLKHCRQLKYCTRGVKLFCEQNGINYIDAAINGIDCEVLRKLNDHRVQLLIEKAESEWADQRK